MQRCQLLWHGTPDWKAFGWSKGLTDQEDQLTYQLRGLVRFAIAAGDSVDLEGFAHHAGVRAWPVRA